MTRLQCRSCAALGGETFIDLGMQPVSNAFRTAAQQLEEEMFFPLRVFVCPNCLLVQLEDFGSRDEHFHSDYVYFSSFSNSWLAHARTYAAAMISRFGLGAGSHVVELASNDGYLLRHFVAQGIPCMGVDPSANVAAAAVRSGVPTLVAFFGRTIAEQMVANGLAADLVPANNVLAHVPDINDFVAGVRILLKPGGIATFEFPHLLNLIEQVQFDTIYHEHYSYLSLTALLPLFHRHGLAAFDVEHLETHGGSLRVFVAPAAAGRGAAPGVAACLAREAAAGLAEMAGYRGFGPRVQALKLRLRRLLIELKSQGAVIAAYGAPAKGNTLLNYAAIRSDLVDYTVDRNPAKQGRFLPGTGIPVLAPQVLTKRRPDYLLVLPWNLAEEIMAQEAGIGAWGGKFILPSPEPRVVAA